MTEKENKKKKKSRDFPGGSVVRTLLSLPRALESGELKSHKPCHVTEKKEKSHLWLPPVSYTKIITVILSVYIVYDFLMTFFIQV